MGKFHIPAGYLLGLLCAAVVAFPALAVAGAVSVDVSPTTGYTSTTNKTFSPPPRSSTSAVQSYNPTVGPYGNGGVSQTMRSGITITGVKEGSQTLSSTISSRVNATAAAMRNGALRCVTSARCNVALIGGAAGIQALLDGIGGLIDDSGRINVTRQGDYPNVPPAVYDRLTLDNRVSTSLCGNKAVCRGFISSPGVRPGCVTSTGPYRLLSAVRVGNAPGADCYYTSDPSYQLPPDVTSPLSPSAAESTINSSYSPKPSDWPYVSGGIDWSHPGVDVEIVDIPSISGSDSPTFIENSDGTSSGTYSEYEFTWGSPSKQPDVSVNEKTTETTYGPSGEIINTTITNNNSSGSPANTDIEIPTDCDFMPTVCRFIDWFTEPDPELSQEPDFTQLIDTIDIEREFTVGSSTASCPAPFQITERLK